MSKIVINRNQLRIWMLGVIALLVVFALIGILFQYNSDTKELSILKSKFINTFDFARETNIPTLFNTVLLVLNALLLVVIWRCSIGESRRLAWLLLGLLALGLAYDEYATVHESFARAISGRYPEIFFVIPYAVVSGVIGILFLPIFIRLEWHVKFLMIAASITYIFGALDSLRLISNAVGLDGETGVFGAAITIGEEVLEMIGLVILADTLVLLISRLETITFVIRDQSK